jgi:apolipoprotein D and lipocalin family protein
MRTLRGLLGLMFLLGIAGCAGTGNRAPIALAEDVDLARFMGDWYVIGNIPTFIETEAYNALEQYRLADDGTIATTFTFRKGAFDGPLKRYEPTGFVVPGTGNAVWKMQFVWPFKADYRIVHLDPDYRFTIIGRTARDYLWIMARDPDVDEATYARLVALAVAEGYDAAAIRRVPQRW